MSNVDIYGKFEAFNTANPSLADCSARYYLGATIEKVAHLIKGQALFFAKAQLTNDKEFIKWCDDHKIGKATANSYIKLYNDNEIFKQLSQVHEVYAELEFPTNANISHKMNNLSVIDKAIVNTTMKDTLGREPTNKEVSVVAKVASENFKKSAGRPVENLSETETITAEIVTKTEVVRLATEALTQPKVRATKKAKNEFYELAEATQVEVVEANPLPKEFYEALETARALATEHYKTLLPYLSEMVGKDNVSIEWQELFNIRL